MRGMVDESGKYLLRMQDDGDGTEYLIRYVVDGKAAFKKISTESLQPLGETEERRT